MFAKQIQAKLNWQNNNYLLIMLHSPKQKHRGRNKVISASRERVIKGEIKTTILGK